MADWLKCQISSLVKYRQNQNKQTCLSVFMAWLRRDMSLGSAANPVLLQAYRKTKRVKACNFKIIILYFFEIL